MMESLRKLPGKRTEREREEGRNFKTCYFPFLLSLSFLTIVSNTQSSLTFSIVHQFGCFNDELRELKARFNIERSTKAQPMVDDENDYLR